MPAQLSAKRRSGSAASSTRSSSSSSYSGLHGTNHNTHVIADDGSNSISGSEADSGLNYIGAETNTNTSSNIFTLFNSTTASSTTESEMPAHRNGAGAGDRPPFPLVRLVESAAQPIDTNDGDIHHATTSAADARNYGATESTHHAPTSRTTAGPMNADVGEEMWPDQHYSPSMPIEEELEEDHIDDATYQAPTHHENDVFSSSFSSTAFAGPSSYSKQNGQPQSFGLGLGFTPSTSPSARRISTTLSSPPPMVRHISGPSVPRTRSNTAMSRTKSRTASISTAHRGFPAVFQRVESQPVQRDENGRSQSMYRTCLYWFCTHSVDV